MRRILSSLAALALAGPVAALTSADLDNMVEIFDERCLAPLMAGSIPTYDGFRLPTGENERSYGGTVTLDDRIMFHVYVHRGLIGCDTSNSLNTAPADGADYFLLVERLDRYADTLAGDGRFIETSHCLLPIDDMMDNWARAFQSVAPSRPQTHVRLLISATQRFANGGPSLQEHYGTASATCEAGQ